MRERRFTQYAWGVLAFTLLIILWGALVRATGSGAGCGRHWPLCDGQIIPSDGAVDTFIEFGHRISSGLSLIAVVGMAVWAWRLFPAGHRVRKAAGWATFFIFTEALLGAGLVLLELVAYNVSISRAYWMAAHLVNNFLLITALALTPWFAGGGAALRLRNQGSRLWALGAAFAGLLVLGASGGVTALGDTLMLGGGISPDSSPVVATLRDLRIFHPAIALVVGVLVALAAWVAGRHPDPRAQQFAVLTVSLYAAQLALGMLNIWLMAPVWIQILHLLLSLLIWIALTLLAAVALPAASAAKPDTPRPAGRAATAAR